MKFIDCFMYYDEDMVLDIRLNILDKFVYNRTLSRTVTIFCTHCVPMVFCHATYDEFDGVSNHFSTMLTPE